ncbi:hypothetical protein ACFWEK_20860, partial [Isoptericola sp. NPDC060257]
QPLYRTLVLASLLSARIRASVAVATTRALYDAGLRDPRTSATGARLAPPPPPFAPPKATSEQE